MPRKDKNSYREYMREWYARPENRKRVIEKVAERKHTAYAGVCRNCGGPTVGTSKNKTPEWCGKPECRSAQRRHLYAENPEKFLAPNWTPRSTSTAWSAPSEPSRYFRREEEDEKGGDE